MVQAMHTAAGAATQAGSRGSEQRAYMNGALRVSIEVRVLLEHLQRGGDAKTAQLRKDCVQLLDVGVQPRRSSRSSLRCRMPVCSVPGCIRSPKFFDPVLKV